MGKPWGMGRPGWHVECSAMVNKYLGKTIDIHSGGKDLIFPHHENEIAQSEAANGCPFAHYWLHNGYINIDNQKMSKSLGNFFTVRDVAKKYDYEVIRYFMLSAHYRNPINFSDEMMEQAKVSLERLYNCLENLQFLEKTADDAPLSEKESQEMEQLKKHKTAFIAAMDDDLNTADAISSLFDLVKDINTMTAEGEKTKTFLQSARDLLKELGGVLGLLQKEMEEKIAPEIMELVERRSAARKEKNWALADQIRDQLAEKGYEVKDTPQGPKVSAI